VLTTRRVRHRLRQALALVALSALLTTSACLGPLYQRAVEQALTTSVLTRAAPGDRALRLTSNERSADELRRLLPTQVVRFFAAPVVARDVPVAVDLPRSADSVHTRLYAVDEACARLDVVSGRCPAASGEVLVSTADLDLNGWSVGSRAPFAEEVEADDARPVTGELTVVGTYRVRDDEWLGVPTTGRTGTEIPDIGPATDDWVTSPQTVTDDPTLPWSTVTTSVVWPLDLSAVDHDDLLRTGAAVDGIRLDALDGSGSLDVLPVTDLPGLAERVARGSEQGRTTIVVLASQLLVLVAVVLWLVLAAATGDRRAELALVRLRGRGRRGAAAYLWAELAPLGLAGVVLGVLAAPLVTGLVARVVFPVPVQRELTGGFVLAAAGAAVAVLGVVLVASRRAAREPVDSLLRAVPSSAGRLRAGVAEVAVTVFSLSAVAALLTGHLDGPLATLAPTLLAVAVGLLLGRVVVPVTRGAARRLLRRGRAVAATGLLSSVRRPAARPVLVMVVVATALVTFCLDALVTGQHNRQSAAEQQNGARSSLRLASETGLAELRAAVLAVDPDRRHLTPVVTTTNNGSRTAPTVAVDPVALPRVALFPRGAPSPGLWAAIAAPDIEPLRLTGSGLSGVVTAQDLQLRGPARRRVDELRVALRYVAPDGRSLVEPLSVIPTGDGSTSFGVSLPCAEGCTVTGVQVTAPVGGRTDGTLVLHGLAVDGQPFTLGAPDDWPRVSDIGGTLTSGAAADGGLAVAISSETASPPVLTHAWVPQPVAALVSGDEAGEFLAPGPDGQIAVRAAGRLPRVPGSPPGTRVVDLESVLRRPEARGGTNVVEVWSDDDHALGRLRSELRERGLVTVGVTTVDEVRADLDASAAAWSLALSVLVGLLAVLVAALVVLVATATTWRARAADLAALRMAGLRARLLVRVELLGQLPLIVLGGVVGAACGLVAGTVALPGVRQFTDPPAVDTTDFATPWTPVLSGATVALAVLVLVAAAAAWWTARRATLELVRESV
jgi:putative ABC transport system permease protein